LKLKESKSKIKKLNSYLRIERIRNICLSYGAGSSLPLPMNITVSHLLSSGSYTLRLSLFRTH